MEGKKCVYIFPMCDFILSVWVEKKRGSENGEWTEMILLLGMPENRKT